MGVTVQHIVVGDGAQPVAGQKVTIAYTGWIKDTSKPENKGKEFDSSRDRGDFVTVIGEGAVIQGWEEGVPKMKVGGTAMLDITSDYGYGARGFGKLIPANSDLLFEVTLKKVE